MEQLSHNHTDNSDELLSAYIDNAVDAGERRRAEQYIAACAACAQEVQELRMFRELLRELPNVQPRRSFTLDPATVAPQRRLLFPTLRWSSLVAALLFVVVLGVDVLGGSAPGAPTAASVSSPAASVAKASPAAGTLFDSSGGSAESMAQPQGSPPAPIDAEQANPEAASLPLTAASPAASAAAVPEASASPAANDALLAEASPAASGYVPPAVAAAESPAASAAASPAMARNSQTPAAPADPAGGNSAQLPQSQFQSDDTAAADTIQLAPNARAQGSWWSIYGLRVAEVALGLIALVLGGAALWTWRRQL